MPVSSERHTRVLLLIFIPLLSLLHAHCSATGQNGLPSPAAASNETACVPIKLGNLVFSFDSDRGFLLSDAGIPLIQGTSLRVKNAAWKRVYFNLAQSFPNITIDDESGGKKITVTNVLPNGRLSEPDVGFAYVLQIRVSPAQPAELRMNKSSSEVQIRLTYELRKTLNAQVEMCFGLLNSNPIKGQGYTGTLGGKTFQGILPAAPNLHTTRKKPFRMAFNALSVESRLGVWSVLGSGDYPVLSLSDARGEHWAVDSGKSVFWLGIPEASLTTGRKTTLGATLRFSPYPPLRVTALPPSTVETKWEPTAVRDARIPVEKSLQLIPQPQQFEPRKDDFVFDEATKIFLPPHPTKDDIFIAEILVRELDHIYKTKVSVEPWNDTTTSGKKREPINCIVLGETNVNPASDRICRKERLEVSPQSPGPEGYVISVTPQYVLVAGSDRAGTFYGVQTLLQMLTCRSDGSVVVQGGLVRDYPDFAFRGVHLLADDYAETWISDLITRILARHKINHIVLECEYAKWDSHPEIHQPWGMTKDEMRRVKELANRYYIQVTPLIQSLGHCEWMFANGQNLDLVEDPQHVYAYCPSNPTSYAFLFDIFKEAIELFQPKYLHIGHDEVTNKGVFGQCRRCVGRPASTLFAENVRLLHEFLAARNVRTMMWGDMLLTPIEAPDAAHGGPPYNIYEARSLIARDIIICDWHYNPARDYPSANLFKQCGFEIIGSTWHDRRNIFYFSKAAKQVDALGMLQTTWTGYRGNRTALQRQANQIAAYLVAAEYFWSVGNPQVDALPYRPLAALRDNWVRKPAVRDAQMGFVIDLSPLTNIDFMDIGNDGSWLRYGARHDLRRMPSGTVRMGSLLFRVPSRRNGVCASGVMLRGPYLNTDQFPSNVVIPVQRKASELAFLHTCGWRVADGRKVGEYEVIYSDGSSRPIELIYGENIYAWDDEMNSLSDGAAWHGVTVMGALVSICAFTWENPFPDKVIQHILARTQDTEASPILIAITGMGETRNTNGATLVTITTMPPPQP